MGIKFNPLIFGGFDLTGGSSGTSIGSPVTGGISGSVLFVDASGNLGQDPTDFTYDSTTNALTVAGTVTASNFSGSSSGTNTGDVTIGTANGLSIVGQVLSLQLSDSTHTGALSSTDWNTFNNKANSNLNNLTSPTSINQDLIPGSDNTLNLGSSSDRWAKLWSEAVDAGTAILILNGTEISASNLNITSVANPNNPQDAATKGYVDNLVQGLNWKAAARSATTTTLPAYTYNNGASGVGATLTGNVNGALTAQDGVTLVVNDRLLVKDETAGNRPYNGIYYLSQVGSAGTQYILTRAVDADSTAQLQYATIQVGSEATTQGGYIYRESEVLATMGTSNVLFALLSKGLDWIFNNGLTTTGNVVDVAPGDASLTATAGSLIVREDPAGAITTGGSGILVNVDNSTIDISANAIEVKAGGITNTQVNASAAIAYSKLAALTINRALQSDGSGFVSVSATTATELGFVSGVTSSIQTQITAKANRTLNNLQTTAVNIAINPDSDNAYTLGTASLRWQAVNAVQLTGLGSTPLALTNNATTTRFAVDTDTTTPNGTSVGAGLRSAGATALSLFTITRTVSADLTLETGNGTAGNSGNITIQTGTATGTRGNISLNAPSTTASGTFSASNFSGSSSGTNTGDVTLTAFGSTPNANGASLSGQALTLQPADGTNPGGVSITTQTFAGNKTFTGSIQTNTSLKLEDPGAGTNTITIQAPTLSAGYTLTLPTDDGTTNQFLQTDGSGVLTWATVSTGSAGDITETSFSAANNQAAAANVTGFAFANGVVRSFSAQISIFINATSSLYAVYQLNGIQKGSSWEMSQDFTGDTTGIIFSITTAGQIQYTSSNIAGFTSDTMKFRAITTSV